MIKFITARAPGHYLPRMWLWFLWVALGMAYALPSGLAVYMLSIGAGWRVALAVFCGLAVQLLPAIALPFIGEWIDRHMRRRFVRLLL
jgi:hypothetical protein